MKDAYVELAEIGVYRSLMIGEVLCEEGGTDTDVFVVISGRLEAVRATAHGPTALAEVHSGELAGEVTNAMGGSRTATLRAAEPTTVSVIAQPAFEDWLARNPQAAAIVTENARLRLNRTRAAAALVGLFGLDNNAVVDAFVDEIRWTTLAPGESLFEQGDVSDAAYVIVAGRLHLRATDAQGNSTLDIEVGRGEIVGEMGLIQDAPRSASARAIRVTTLAHISRDSFESLCATYPVLLLRFFHTIIDRLTHHHTPDGRARIIGLAVTAPDVGRDLLSRFVSALEPFGSAFHLGPENLDHFVRDPSGPGATNRVAEFLHQADIGHDYVFLEADRELTEWSVSVAKQSDRFIVFCSAHPDAEERRRITAQLDQLSDEQRRSCWLARLHPAGTDSPRGSASYIDALGVAEVHNLRLDRAPHLRRLARLATGNGRGVVLGGGGAKGFAHIGALRALTEAGLEYDRLGGASMGALVGAFAARDTTHEEMVETAIAEFDNGLLDYTVPVVSVMKAAKMTSGLENQFGQLDIADLWVPFYCVSTNLTGAELCVHRRGPLVRALRASTAIPGALPPVPIDGDLHVDGGVLDNVPVRAMVDDTSIGTVVAVDVSPAGGPCVDSDYGLSVSGLTALWHRMSRARRPTSFPGIASTVMSSMLIGSSQAKKETIEAVDLYLSLELDDVGLLNFENHREVAQRGYDLAGPAIAAWQQ